MHVPELGDQGYMGGHKTAHVIWVSSGFPLMPFFRFCRLRAANHVIMSLSWSLRLLEAPALSQSFLVLHGLVTLKSNRILIQFHAQRSGENSAKHPCLPFTQSHELLLSSICFIKCFLYFLSLSTLYPFSEPGEGDLTVILPVTSKYSARLS